MRATGWITKKFFSKSFSDFGEERSFLFYHFQYTNFNGFFSSSCFNDKEDKIKILGDFKKNLTRERLKIKDSKESEKN